MRPGALSLIEWPPYFDVNCRMSALPIGVLAFWKVYGAGHVDIRLATLLALGFFIGGYFGGSLAQLATSLQLRRIFAICLAGIAVKMFLQK